MTATVPALLALRVVTVGNPNVGKTSLINAIAGSDLKVGNWPGTTVDRLSVDFELGDRAVHLVDLPGAYSLAGATAEERITREELLAHPPDVVINVIDAANLERNLHLTLELSELAYPMVVVLNLNDEAADKGIHVDPAALQARLKVPVVATVASKGHGVDALKDALREPGKPATLVRYSDEIERQIGENRWESLCRIADGEAEDDPFLAIMEARFQTARDIALHVTRREQTGPTWGERLDGVVLHRYTAVPLFLLAMLAMFRFTYYFSDPWIQYLDTVKTVLTGWLAAVPMHEQIRSFLSEGVIDGAGTVMAFAPVLFLLYLAMAFWESSGLLARTAFVCDRMMKMAGLPGRALIPLVLGFGCNVPAIYAARAMPHFGDRLRVALAIPFMACSARLTVFVLFAGIFFPQHASWVVFGLYLLGLAAGLGTAWLLRSVIPMENDVTGVMELPPYRFPTLSAVVRQAKLRTGSFLKDATGPIMVTVLAVWLLHQIPPGPPDRSLFADSSRVLARALAPLGIDDWRLAGALIPGFIAKEVVVGTLGITYLGSEPTAPLRLAAGLHQLGTGLLDAMKATAQAVPLMVGIQVGTPAEEEVSGSLRQALAQSVAPATALAYLVFVLLYTPCVATVAAIRQEFGTRWAAISVVYQMAAAFVLAALVGWIARG